MSSSEHRTERQKNTVVAVLVILKRGLRIDGPNKRVIFIFSNPRKIKGFLGNKKDFTPTNANQ